eukprot:886864-Rhodomonas_salina.1
MTSGHPMCHRIVEAKDATCDGDIAEDFDHAWTVDCGAHARSASHVAERMRRTMLRMLPVM